MLGQNSQVDYLSRIVNSTCKTISIVFKIVNRCKLLQIPLDYLKTIKLLSVSATYTHTYIHNTYMDTYKHIHMHTYIHTYCTYIHITTSGWQHVPKNACFCSKSGFRLMEAPHWRRGEIFYF